MGSVYHGIWLSHFIYIIILRICNLFLPFSDDRGSKPTNLTQSWNCNFVTSIHIFFFVKSVLTNIPWSLSMTSVEERRKLRPLGSPKTQNWISKFDMKVCQYNHFFCSDEYLYKFCVILFSILVKVLFSCLSF